MLYGLYFDIFFDFRHSSPILERFRVQLKQWSGRFEVFITLKISGLEKYQE